MMQQKRLFDSYILNYADVENLSPDTNEYKIGGMHDETDIAIRVFIVRL